MSHLDLVIKDVEDLKTRVAELERAAAPETRESAKGEPEPSATKPDQADEAKPEPAKETKPAEKATPAKTTTHARGSRST